jgi:hypothetical protein
VQHRTRFTKSLIAASAVCILSLGLSACGKESPEGDDVAALDEKLTGKGSDPAMKSALNEKILVDPIWQAVRTAMARAADKASTESPADTG